MKSPVLSCPRPADLQARRRLLMLLLSMSGGAAGAQAPSFRVAFNDATEPLLPLVRAVYAELGMQPEFVRVPAQRAIVDTDRGLYDADLSRAGGTLGAYAHLLQTREPLRRTELYAVILKDSGLQIRGPADLRGRSLGLLHGAKLAEEFVQQHGFRAQPAHSMSALRAMLEARRFEVALVTSIQWVVQGADLGHRAVRVDTPLMSGFSYHVLNRRHVALAPRFDAALQALKKSGRAEQLLRQGVEAL